MDEEETLENSIKQYEAQLMQVVTSLEVASEDVKNDLEVLKDSLEQLIQLTKENLISLKKKRLLQELEASTSYMLEKNEPESISNSVDIDNNLDDELAALEGTKCRAPFSQEWGEYSYHNALIFKVEPHEAIESTSDIKVHVMFCNPLNTAMQPCPFYLNGNCRFSDSKCRYSHGHLVRLDELHEFQMPSYESLQTGSKCLVQYSSGLWYTGVVEEALENDQFLIKYNQTGTLATVGLDKILPVQDKSSEESGSSNSEEELKQMSFLSDEQNDAEFVPVNAWRIEDFSTQPLGIWERHTKGIGSKLLAKMGYVIGQGLGKNGEGRMEPIEAVILPAGKSLDKCIELREKGLFDPQLRKLKKIQKRQKNQQLKIARGYYNNTSTVFDFLNKKLSSHTDAKTEQQKLPAIGEINLKTASNHYLNVKALEIDKHITETENELQKLQSTLQRNASDKTVSSHMRPSIVTQESNLENLKTLKRMIHFEQNCRKETKKFAVF